MNSGCSPRRSTSTTDALHAIPTITRVLPDANVLYSRTLRDWLFLLRNASGMYTVQTTEDIICEVGVATRRKHPAADARKVADLVTALRKNVDEILTSYADDPGYAGTDPFDRHVHSAAASGDVDVLLTADGGFNFDDSRYEVHTPDAFFCLADDSQPQYTTAVALEQAAYWATRPSSRSLPEALVRAGCPDFSARVTERLTDALRRPVGGHRTRLLRD